MTGQTHRCIIIGASHAGVNAAFSLRQEGYEGEIVLYDSKMILPYHRPPLSKGYLLDPSADKPLRPLESYADAGIDLRLGCKVLQIHPDRQTVELRHDEELQYSELIIATGASALVPPIPGLAESSRSHVLREKSDVLDIVDMMESQPISSVIIIGGGYIGLEIAASMRKMNRDVTLIEREECILARAAAPWLSEYISDRHHSEGVKIHTQTQVTEIIDRDTDPIIVRTNDGQSYEADMLILGVGIRLNTQLAQDAGLRVDGGIVVDEYCRSSAPHIYAIGDCTYHKNTRYSQHMRLENVQNAVDQAKVAASHICGKAIPYDSVPWFWSDQYDMKYQSVGVYDQSHELIVRHTVDQSAISAWYFDKEELVAVSAINDPRAYMLGMKVIKNSLKINKELLKDIEQKLSPKTLILSES